MSSSTLYYDSENSSLLPTRSNVSDEESIYVSEKQNKFGGFQRVSNLVSGCLGILFGMMLLKIHDHKLFLEKYNFRYRSYGSLDEGQNPKNSRYLQVQTLGFNIYTGGASAFLNASYDSDNTIISKNSNLMKNPECSGRNAYGVLGGWEFMCYLGNKDEFVDVTQRLQIMQDAINRAYEVASKDKSTLKIFMAPEFYWRGLDGAYVFAEESRCGPVCEILKGLEEMVADKRFEDWLFVFGTAVASDIPPNEDGSDRLFYNFAPIYRGYDPAKYTYHGKRFLLPKRYVSKIDFLTPQRHFDERLVEELVDEPLPEHDTTVHNPVDFRQFKYGNIWKKYKQSLQDMGYNMIEYGWIVVDEVVLSIEICYDHKKRSALTSYLADLVTGSTTLIPSTGVDKKNGLSFVPIPNHQAHVSLVASAGMTIQPDSLVLTNNGTVFLQDGLSDDNSTMISSGDIMTFDRQLMFDGGVEAVQREAILTDTDSVFVHRLVDQVTTYSIYDGNDQWQKVLGGIFSVNEYEPKIAVFDPIEVAY